MQTQKVSKKKPVAQLRGAPRTTSPEEQTVQDLLSKFREQMEKEDFKVTTADFMRLLQYEREYGKQGPKDVVVSWIEPADESKS